MQIKQIDPRTAKWEAVSPRYRVYFWEKGPTVAGVSPERVGYASDEYELTGATDVREVIAWADENSGPGQGVMHSGSDRTYTLYAVIDQSGTTGLIQLAGVDPNRHLKMD